MKILDNTHPPVFVLYMNVNKRQGEGKCVVNGFCVRPTREVKI
jgi:hypothetical protein